MGACASTARVVDPEAKKNNDKIEKKLVEDQKMTACKKLLLLGAGESGKSTLFKQMIKLYGDGLHEDDRKAYRHVVYNNTLEAMKALVEQAELWQESPPLDNGKKLDGSDFALQAENEEHKKLIMQLELCLIMTRFKELSSSAKAKVGTAIAALWQDPAIQLTYSHRSKFQLLDSAKYFFDRVEQTMKQGYLPSIDDVLRTRVRTTGIVETTFTVGSDQFNLLDVGGQRTERKKWINCFEDVDAVIFVAAISEYDQVLFEDDDTNRVWEALELFSEICNSRWFRKTCIVLFLNKKDIFEDKIPKTPITTCFPEFTGNPHNVDQCREYMRLQFEAENKQRSRPILTHVTCATDSSIIKSVFDKVALDIVADSDKRLE